MRPYTIEYQLEKDFNTGNKKMKEISSANDAGVIAQYVDILSEMLKDDYKYWKTTGKVKYTVIRNGSSSPIIKEGFAIIKDDGIRFYFLNYLVKIFFY